MPLRVLINAVGVQSGGGLTQLRHFVPLAAADPEIEYVLAVSRDDLIRLVDGIEVIVPKLRGSRNLGSTIWHQVSLPRIASEVDLVLSVANHGPIWNRRPHVLFARNVKHMEKQWAGPGTYARDALARAATRRADAVLVPSVYMADVVRRAGVPRDRLTTCSHGYETVAPDRSILSAPGPRAWMEADRRYLYVGSSGEHKNLELLAENLGVLTGPGASLMCTLSDGEMASSRLVGSDAYGIGGVDAPALAALYSEATCVIVPSKRESFSLPVLEALGNGAPVAISDIPAHRELAGELAPYFDPTSDESFGRALTRVPMRDDPEWREAVRERVARHSWKEQYEIIRAALMSTAERTGS